MPFAFREVEFANGLRLLLLPTNFPGLVSLYSLVSVGSRHERASTRGFAHLFEHCLFRGSASFPGRTWDDALIATGALANAFTEDDYTAFHSTFPKEALPRILQLEADRFQYPAFTEEDYFSELEAIASEYRHQSADPLRRIQTALRKAAFPSHPYRYSPLSPPQELHHLQGSRSLANRFYAQHYRPERTTLFLIGDLEGQPVAEWVEESWSNWRRGRSLPEAPLPETTPPNASQPNATLPEPTPSDAAQLQPSHTTLPSAAGAPPWLAVGFRAPGLLTHGQIRNGQSHHAALAASWEEVAALDLLTVIGFGEGSPLHQELVMERHLADSLYSSYERHADSFLFTIYVRVKREDAIAPVEQALLSALLQLRTQPVTPSQLTRSLMHLRYRFSLRLDSNQHIGRTLADFVGITGTPAAINQLFAAYARVTPAKLQAVVRRYLSPAARLVVVLRALPAAEPSL